MWDSRIPLLLALLGCLGTRGTSAHPQLETRTDAGPWLVAPFCAPGQSNPGCCCARGDARLLTQRTKQTVTRTISSTRTIKVTITVAADGTVKRALSERRTADDAIFELIPDNVHTASHLDDNRHTNDFEPSDWELQLQRRDGQRNICPVCPSGVTVVPYGSSTSKRGPLCCPKRKTVTLTRTWTRTLKKLVRKTLTVTRTAPFTTAFVQPPTAISVFVFTDLNGNHVYDQRTDRPESGVSISLVRFAGGARALPEVLASGVSGSNGTLILRTTQIGPNNMLGISLTGSGALLASFNSDGSGNVPAGAIHAPIPLVPTSTSTRTATTITTTASRTSTTTSQSRTSSTTSQTTSSSSETTSSTSETTSSTTSQTTTSITRTSSTTTQTKYTHPACLDPRVIGGQFIGGTATDCCTICWTLPNCFLYAYFLEPGTCYSILATDNINATHPAVDTRVTGVCPLGVSPTTQISTDTNDPGFGGYMYGPCDIDGPTMWPTT